MVLRYDAEADGALYMALESADDVLAEHSQAIYNVAVLKESS